MKLGCQWLFVIPAESGNLGTRGLKRLPHLSRGRACMGFGCQGATVRSVSKSGHGED
jgi:hypothetical protein